MPKETQIGNLVIDLELKTKALEEGLETAKKKLKEIEQQNEEIIKNNNKLDVSFIAVAGVITASLVKVNNVINSSMEEYKQYTQAMSGLKDVADYTGQGLDELGSIMDDFSSYMTKADLAATIKNFSLMNMTAEQTRQMIESLTNSAIKNRNANYTVSEAVKVASDGYKQGLSTLSDSAGVTENLSVMLEKYAESIGKTTSQLTEEEKNQAYVNRTMEAAAPFANAMAEYNESFAGTQGELSNSFKETQVAYAETLEPAYKQMLEMLNSIVSGLGNFISEHKSATTGITTFVVTLGSLTLILTTAKKAYDTYKASAFAATVAQKGFNAAVMVNPLGLLVTGISALVGIFTTINSKFSEMSEAEEINEIKTKQLREAQEKYNSVLNGTIDLQDEATASYLNSSEQSLQKYSQLYSEVEKMKKEENISDTKLAVGGGSKELRDKIEQLKSMNKEIKDIMGIEHAWEIDIKNVNKGLEAFSKEAKKANSLTSIANAFNTEAIQKQQQEAAVLKITASEMQNYLKIVKDGNKNTEEYQNAVNALSKAYPEASKNGILLLDVLEGLISAEQLQADEAWNASQASIQGHINNIQVALDDENVQRQVAQNMGIAYDENFRPKLESILALLQMIGGYTPDNVPNIAPTSVPKISRTSSGSSSYSNKRLDNYKKEIEHKKALDQLSLQDEINMYEYALKYYAKTVDERNELTEKIYSLNKEMAEKQKELIDNTVSQLTSAIQKQLEEMQKADEEMINNNIKKVEEWKDKRIAAINEEYETRINAIQKELDLLDKSEEEKTRAEEDAEYERKKKRLEELVEFEHDATTKINYQKELNKLIEEYQKTLDSRALSDKKEALRNQQNLLSEEQNNIVDAIEKEAENQTEILNNQLTAVQEYYSIKNQQAEHMAEQLILDTENNQNQILELLNNYGNDYEIVGKSLGEKLIQGINNGVENKISNIIQSIQNNIEAGINNKISSLLPNSYNYSNDVGGSSNVIKNVTVNQNNTFAQMQDMPSETYRKLENISQELASLLD